MSHIFTREIDEELERTKKQLIRARSALFDAENAHASALLKKACDTKKGHQFIDGGGGGPMGGRFIEICKNCKYENHV